MIVELWANKIIKGEKTFDDVPRLLKEKVKQYLVSKGKVYLTVKNA